MQPYHPLLVLTFQIVAPCAALLASLVAIGIARSSAKERARDRRRASEAQALMVIVKRIEPGFALDGSLTDCGVTIHNTGSQTIVRVISIVESQLDDFRWEWISDPQTYLPAGEMLTAIGGEAIVKGRRHVGVTRSFVWWDACQVYVEWTDAEGNSWRQIAQSEDRPIALGPGETYLSTSDD